MNNNDNRLCVEKKQKSSAEDILKLENLALRIENEKLKKELCQGTPTKAGIRFLLRSDYEIIEKLSSEFPVKTLCKIMNVNRSGYYKWKARKEAPNRYEKYRTELTDLLMKAHQKHQTYGYHRLAQLVREETGLIFSDNLAHKCCKEANIKAKGRKTYRITESKTKSVDFPNIVGGKWNATRPMEIVVSDMTLLKNKNGEKYEWTYILDTFNNEIIASDISKSSGSKQHYYNCLQTLIDKTKAQEYPVVLHTDQGNVYSSKAFKEAHDDCANLQRSMSRKGTPTDNPIIEAINGWAKEELYIDFNLYQSDDVPSLVEKYVEYYNNRRYSTKCNGKSPIQYRTELGY